MRLRRPFTWWQRIGRLIDYRLMVPLKRAQHPPEYTARAVMVGVFWAFTPLIGIQMWLVGLTWLGCRYHHRFDFNLIIALAWTWVTNVATMLPTYYVFYLTGHVIMGNIGHHAGYGAFSDAWQSALEADGMFGPLLAYAETIATEQGLAIAIGWIPWALVLSWLGYRWTYRFVVRRHEARAARMARHHARAYAKEAAAAAAAAARADRGATASRGGRGATAERT